MYLEKVERVWVFELLCRAVDLHPRDLHLPRVQAADGPLVRSGGSAVQPYFTHALYHPVLEVDR